ncbi:MAG: DALR anticodon-binding domain-containing protein [Planktothrix sp.]|uniref:DALR anticodon-binding domain-containing protein n=1 Tax=Planktothrix sp. TaxID=3088171 RepID=UPI0038D4C469
MLALAQVLGIQLRESLQVQGINMVDSQEIPVTHIKHKTQILYGSAIALKLASQLHQSPFALAEALCLRLNTLSSSSPLACGTIPRDVTVQVLSSGMLQFIFTDVGIAAWLEQILRCSKTPTSCQNLEISSDLFQVQYSHARCCSLLCLAEREHLITLAEPNLISGKTIKISAISSQISWLNNQNQLQFTQSYDYQLLTQLVVIIDALILFSDSTNWLKLAVQLSDSFQQFYRYCRIWGEVKQQTPELAQARLGLVSITQFLLRILLEEKLGIMAPEEL